MVFPWIIISTGVRAYQPHLENLINAETLLAYARVIPGLYGWPLVVFALLGFARIIMIRSAPGVIAILGFVLLYVLFTADDPFWIPVNRFTVLMVPFIVIIASFSFTGRFGLPKRKSWIILWLGLGFLPLWAWHSGDNFPVTALSGRISSEELHAIHSIN
jgi:hypothetical protein